MARTFLITLSIFLCLVLPAQADTVPSQRLLIGEIIGENGASQPLLGQVTSAPDTSSQAVPQKTGLSAYRKNLERLRSKQDSNTSPKDKPSSNESSPNEPLSATKDQPTKAPSIQAPPLSKKTPSAKQKPFFRNRSNQQFVFPTEKEQKKQKQQIFQDANKENSPQEKSKKSFLNQGFRNNTVQNENDLDGAETSDVARRAYDMIQAAQQPYSGQNKTFLARPNLPKPTLPKSPTLPNVTPQDVSERVSQLHARLRQQPARLNKTVVEPLQGKVTELKEQVGTTAKTALQQQLDNRGIAEGQIGHHIQTTKTNLKTAVINFLKHIEHKAHKAAEQLGQG